MDTLMLAEERFDEDLLTIDALLESPDADVGARRRRLVRGRAAWCRLARRCASKPARSKAHGLKVRRARTLTPAGPPP